MAHERIIQIYAHTARVPIEMKRKSCHTKVKRTLKIMMLMQPENEKVSEQEKLESHKLFLEREKKNEFSIHCIRHMCNMYS